MLLRFLICLGIAASFSCHAVDKAEAGGASNDPRSDALKPITDDVKLPRVLLIGDSISIDYTLGVRKKLAGVANIHRIPENAAHTGKGVATLDKWLGDGTWDVIHFNFGLHDIKIMEGGKQQISPEDYEANLRTFVKRLKEENAELIFATTTPVPDGNLKPPRNPADLVKYNEIARKVMQENGVAIDDLYNVALPRLAELQQKQNVHFKPNGSDVLADAVVAAIKAALERDAKKDAKPDGKTDAAREGDAFVVDFCISF